MAFPSEIISEIERGQAFYRTLVDSRIASMQDGCMDCSPKDYSCLRSILIALEGKMEIGVYDETSQELVDKMLLIIGEYEVQIPPTVDAGANKSVQVGNSTTFTAIATQGSAPIVSYLWEVVSGSATLTNANQATVTAQGTGVGNVVLRVTVTDGNGLIASDTTNLNVTAAQIQIRWDAFDTEPNLNTVVLTKSMTVNAGFSQATIDFGVDFGDISDKYIVYDYPSTEPDKVNWFNTVLNYGTVPDSAMKAQVIAGGRKRIGSRDPFIFDSSTYTLKIS